MMNKIIESILDFNQLTLKDYDSLIQQNEIINCFEAKGVKEFKEVVERHRKIIVVGDYDCDGICATAILYDALQKSGYEVGYYIPNRLKEGYGLNKDIVDKAYEKGYTLLITVDNGVKCSKEISYAQSLGMECIVSDHHTYDQLPNCLIVHSFLMGEEFKYLSGAGICLYLAHALGIYEDKHIILACCALLADMMQVFGQTRTIIKKGIQLLQENDDLCMGVKYLNEKSRAWNTNTISFNVVSKINACGRLSDLVNVNTIVAYLLSDNRQTCIKTAEKIIAINEKRKQITQMQYELALQSMENDEFIISVNEQFHEGIVGIVAGKLMNDYHKATMIVKKEGQLCKGSMRAPKEINIIQCVEPIKDLFLAYGGHSGACGFQFEYRNLDLIKKHLCSSVKNSPIEQEKKYKVSLDDINFETISLLQQLEPFGQGLQLPNFIMENKDYTPISLAGGKHLKYNLNQDVEILYFNTKETTHSYFEFSYFEESIFRNVKKINIYGIE